MSHDNLQGMVEMMDALPTPDVDITSGNKLMKRLWIARFDVDEPVQKLAIQYVVYISHLGLFEKF